MCAAILTSSTAAVNDTAHRHLIALLQLFTALSYLHQNKVNHRDINPHNVYIDGDGNARLALAAVSKRVAEFVEAHDASVKELDGGESPLS